MLGDIMSEDPVGLLRGLFVARDVAGILACLTEAATVSLPQIDNTDAPRPAAEALAALLIAFPDVTWHPGRRYEAERVIVEEGVWSATYRGSLADMATVARPVRVAARVRYELAGSRIDRVTISTDLAALFVALGRPVQASLLANSAAAYTSLDTPTSTAVIRGSADAMSSGSVRRRRRLITAVIVLAVGAGAGVTLASVRQPHSAAPAGDATVNLSPTSPAPTPTLTQATPTTEAASGPTTFGVGVTPPAIVRGNVNLSTDVLFDSGSATLSPGARQLIDQVAALLAGRHVTGVVQVDGYTDDVGGTAFNLALSSDRANAVVQVLRDPTAGQPITLVAHGYGDADPVADNATAEGRQRNRRVTIHLPASTS